MKKKIMLILLTTFALVGCGGGGSNSEPLVKQPKANTMSVPELKAQDAKKAKEAQDKINNAPVSKGEIDKTVEGLETKITTLEGELKKIQKKVDPSISDLRDELSEIVKKSKEKAEAYEKSHPDILKILSASKTEGDAYKEIELTYGTAELNNAKKYIETMKDSLKQTKILMNQILEKEKTEETEKIPKDKHETKDYKKIETGAVAVATQIDITDKSLYQVIVKKDNILNYQGDLNISRVVESAPGNTAPVSGLAVVNGGKLYNSGTIKLTGIATPKTKQIGMYAAGGHEGGDALAVNLKSIIVETDGQVAMEAVGEGAVIVNYGTIDLKGNGQTAMYAANPGAIAINHGHINLDGSKNVGLKSTGGGNVINAEDGVIILSGKSMLSQDEISKDSLLSQYKKAEYKLPKVDDKTNFGILTDKDSKFTNHGRIEIK